MGRILISIKNERALFVFPLLSSLIVWGIFILFGHHLVLLSSQNFIFLSFSLALLLFALSMRDKNVFDWLIISALIVNFLDGPMKAFFYNYAFYTFSNLLYSLLLITFVWLVIIKVFTIPRSVLALVLSCVVIVKSGCYLIILKAPMEWLHRYDNDIRVFNFYDFEYSLNDSIESLLVIIPVVFLTYSVLVKERSLNTIIHRNIVMFAGVFLIFMTKLFNVFFMFEGYRNGWVHSLIEVMILSPMLIWFIATRDSGRTDKAESRQQLLGLQFSLLFPLVYFIITFQGQRSILITLAAVIYLELLYILFWGLLTQRQKLIELGQAFYDAISVGSIQWGKDYENIIIHDRDGNVIKASDHITELRGQNVIGRNLREMLELKELPPDLTLIDETRLEGWFLAGDGKKHPVLISTQSLQGIHKQLKYSIVSDITKHNKIELTKRELQVKAQELKTMDSLFKMGAGVSHNFNNMLHSMSGFVELAKMSLQTPTKVSKYLDHLSGQIENGAQFTRKMIYSLDDFSTQCESVNIKDALSDAFDELEKIYHGFQKKYDFVIDIDSSLHVSGKVHDIKEIFIQLLSNSIQATPRGNEISIYARHIDPEVDLRFHHPDLSDTMDFIEISVSDTGSGIIKDVAPNIFDPFFSTYDDVGKGLGLTVVYGIIKNYHGTISFKNNADKGVTFTFYLPSTMG